MFQCVGCGHRIPWDGTGIFCYTCPCGGHIFVSDETGAASFPASLVIAIAEKKALPHLDYLVGNSEHTSPEKEMLIKELRSKGAIWMEECVQCQKDGTLAHHRKRLDTERRCSEVYARLAAGELTETEAMEDLRRIHEEEAGG